MRVRITCTTDVTDSAGTWTGVVTDTRPEADLRREALRVACGKRCAASGPTRTPGCVNRCAVDVEAGRDRRARLVQGGHVAMMFAWTFAARTADEVGRLIRALGRHRYLREANLRLHFTVDRALADHPAFGPHAASFEARRRGAGIDLRSRNPALWRAASANDVVLALTTFWTPDEAGQRAKERLLDALEAAGLPAGDHQSLRLAGRGAALPGARAARLGAAAGGRARR